MKNTTHSPRYARYLERIDAPDPSIQQEIIYDESGLEIGETTRIEMLDTSACDPYNTTGRNL